jgi:2-polyprenyl-3-methyl-5-hydroxy-6-metoxy-1,4-benzoquinol methylase
VSSTNELYFDNNAEAYRDKIGFDFDETILDFVRMRKLEEGMFVDVGGGCGTFCNLVKERYPHMSVTIIDPSSKSLDQPMNHDIKKIKGMLPRELNTDDSYDLIHVKEVLHHVVGSSTGESRELVVDSLQSLRDRLEPYGYLIIHELYYESYLDPKLSRDMIFRALSLQNRLRIRIPQQHFVLDLQVCFYTREELRSLLEEAGLSVVDYKETHWDRTALHRLALIKDLGRMLFICQKT